MPFQHVRGLDIRSREEEALVQDVVNLRLETTPLDLDIKRNDIPDIKTKAEEEKWQKIIDERTAKARGIPVKTAQPILEVKVEVPVETVTLVTEPIIEKKKPGRPPKSKECEMCKLEEHSVDCPIRPVSVK